MDKKKGQPSGSKQKCHQDYSKEGKKKWKEEDKKTIATTHQCKNPKKHYNHHNIDGHMKDKCWKIHLEFRTMKKYMLAMDSVHWVESSSYVDEDIIYTTMKNEVNLSSLHPKEEKEITKLFHINILLKKTKVDALFDSIS
jgi:hypothetical protein